MTDLSAKHNVDRTFVEICSVECPWIAVVKENNGIPKCTRSQMSGCLRLKPLVDRVLLTRRKPIEALLYIAAMKIFAPEFLTRFESLENILADMLPIKLFSRDNMI
ncbi:hypothetical protein PsorP6_014471 [Peronosclerospora sorghi]|uniref:Uncharacterized protein n=1 Tax=Peronosclerospora sorghi TaxID=230839 RepID=A0ACC0VRG9_9STRA|nr:hypothetical protein PsorP6_014471 [Peronosclerospora sorghi]